MMSELKQDKHERIVDLCKWVDDHAYKENIDHSKFFLNIQKIIYAIAVNGRIFQNWEDYEPFSLHAATRIYNRYFNGKQFLEDDNPKKITRIKSVLNYVKKLLYPMKVTYQNETFKEILKPDLHLEHIEVLRERLYNSVQQQQNYMLSFEYQHYIQRVSNIIKNFVYTLPNASDKAEIHNIYTSCLLSFLNSITLSNSIKKKIQTGGVRTSNVDQFLEKVYEENIQKSVILFHLPDSMKNYIMTLMARIRHLVKEDLQDIVNSNLGSSAEVFDAILVSAAQEVYNSNEQY